MPTVCSCLENCVSKNIRVLYTRVTSRKHEVLISQNYLVLIMEKLPRWFEGTVFCHTTLRI